MKPLHGVWKQEVGLKWLAVIMMTVDHAAVAFLPYDSGLYVFARNLGRIAAPLFAYLLVAGFLVSRDRKKYRHRLLMYALLSQFPFVLLSVAASPEAADQFIPAMLLSWNVMATLWACALGLQFWTFAKSRTQNKKTACLSLCAAGWLVLSVFADNGGYIPVWVMIFFACRAGRNMAVAGYLAALAFFSACGFLADGLIFPPGIQIWMLPGYLAAAVILCRFSAPAAFYRHSTRPPRWQRDLFYLWYPLHMLVFAVLALRL